MTGKYSDLVSGEITTADAKIYALIAISNELAEANRLKRIEIKLAFNMDTIEDDEA